MAILSNEIIQFAAGNTDYFVAFQDYYIHSKAVNHQEKICDYDHSLSLEEKKAKVDTAYFAKLESMSGVKRTAENANAWAANPSVQWANMALIDATINSVLPLTVNPSIGIYTELRYVSYGDIVKFKVKPRSLYNVSQGAHGERVTYRKKQADGDVIVAPVEHIVTVDVDMYRVLAGKEDLAEFVRLVVMSVETKMTADATLALTNGMMAGTYPSQLSVTGAFAPQTLITLGETVEAYNFGSRPMVVGTAAALAKVVPDSSLGFRGNYDANGGSIALMKDFYGFELMRIPQVATGNYSNFGLALDDSALYLVSPGMDKLVKGVVSNTLTNSNQFYDNADLTQNFTMRKDWNFIFASAAFGGKYEITE